MDLPPWTSRPFSADKFWARFEKQPGGCWTWTGHRNRQGYGMLVIGGEPRLAHRVAWELEYGPIPEGLYVCHECDNPPCGRPAHLFLGSAADNAKDAARKEWLTFEAVVRAEWASVQSFVQPNAVGTGSVELGPV